MSERSIGATCDRGVYWIRHDVVLIIASFVVRAIAVILSGLPASGRPEGRKWEACAECTQQGIRVIVGDGGVEGSQGSPIADCRDRQVWFGDALRSGTGFDNMRLKCLHPMR